MIVFLQNIYRLIHNFTDKIIEQLGHESFVFRILIDFQKSFKTGHGIIIQKLINFWH